MTQSIGKSFAPFRHLVLDLLLSRYCPDFIKTRKPVSATFRLCFYNTILPSQSFKLCFNYSPFILNISFIIWDISYMLFVFYSSFLPFMSNYIYTYSFNSLIFLNNLHPHLIWRILPWFLFAHNLPIFLTISPLFLLSTYPIHLNLFFLIFQVISALLLNFLLYNYSIRSSHTFHLYSIFNFTLNS